MTSRLLDQEWLRKKLSEVFPHEDLYHMFLRDGNYHALQRILKELLYNEKEEISRLEEKKRKCKKADHSLTERYERCAKIERFLADIAFFLECQHQ